MHDLPCSASRRVLAPRPSRLRWQVFAGSLLASAGVALITALAMLVVQRLPGSTMTIVAVGLLAGVSTGALTAQLWTRSLERRTQGWMHVREADSPHHPQNQSSDPSGGLSAEAIPAWQNTVRALQEECLESQDETRRLYETLTEFMRMIAKAVDERAAYLRGHSERVADYAHRIAQKLDLGEEQVERIRLSALLHDIGSLGVEDYLVMKETPLTPVEFDIVKAHTVKGAAILRPIAMLQDLIPGVELHHESLDGMGYPYGLKEDEIPLMARIVAVADSFDAMTTPRPYQAAMNSDYVLEVLERLAGTRYDHAVVGALKQLVAGADIVVKDVRVPVSFRMRNPVAELV